MQRSTPRDERAAARDERRHLQLPDHGLGRADIIRSRSPSPALRAPGVFNFPPQQQQPEQDQFVDAINITTMATEEQLAEIRQQLRDEVRREVRNETTRVLQFATPRQTKRMATIRPRIIGRAQSHPTFPSHG